MLYFYNRTIENLVVAMQSLFNDITVKRYDDHRNVVKELKVPLKFGPLHKFYMRRMEDGTMKRYYIQLPTMAMTITSLQFDAGRSKAQRERRYLLAEDAEVTDETINNFMSDLMPVPWNVGFKIEIRTESFQDWCQIAEQIIPWFDPSCTLRIKEFNSVNMERDVKVTLDGLSPEFQEEMGNEDTRSVNGSLEFTAEMNFYKPITNAAIIKKIKATYGVDPFSEVFDYSNLTPEQYSGILESIRTEQFGTSAITNEESQSIVTSGSTTIEDLPEKEIFGYDEPLNLEKKAVHKALDEAWIKDV